MHWNFCITHLCPWWLVCTVSTRDFSTFSALWLRCPVNSSRRKVWQPNKTHAHTKYNWNIRCSANHKSSIGQYKYMSLYFEPGLLIWKRKTRWECIAELMLGYRIHVNSRSVQSVCGSSIFPGTSKAHLRAALSYWKFPVHPPQSSLWSIPKLKATAWKHDERLDSTGNLHGR